MTDQQRHMQAMIAPRGTEEQALVHLLKGLRQYVDTLGKKPTQRDWFGTLPPGEAERSQSSADLADVVLETADCARRLIEGDVGRLSGELLRDEFDALMADCRAQIAARAAVRASQSDTKRQGKRVHPRVTHIHRNGRAVAAS